MPKYLIEVPHSADPVECTEAIHIFLSTGSHFLSHADWGCSDGIHKCWIMVDVDNKGEARSIIPPAYRARATIVTLNKFTLNEANGVVAYHQMEQ